MFRQARELSMLKDLVSLRGEAESRVGALDGSQIEVSESLKLAFENAFRLETRDDDVKRLDASLFVTTRKTGLSAYIPYQWLSRVQVCSEYITALLEYSEIVTSMKKSLGKEIVKQLPCVSWRQKLNSSDVIKIDDFIRGQLSNKSDIDNFESFIEGLTWQDKDQSAKRGVEGKTLERTDYIGAAVKKSLKLISEMSSKLNKCIDAYMNNLEFRVLVNKATIRPINTGFTRTVSCNKEGENIVYYGAPGTGKSYAIDEIVSACKHVSTVFHPDTQYSDFVGCLKPSMNEADIVYKFREGPFCKALKLAHDNPTENCYLVIEEINRASAAAVFGEIFQLLDRDLDGRSIYGIDVNDPDMLSYLLDNSPSSIVNDQLKLPRNLSIYATMNSSDQAVMPMDTAFKRRWKFKYKPVDFKKCANGQLKIFGKSGGILIDWKSFAECVNSILVSQDVPEDRLLGPWFLKEDELKGEEAASQAITGKLFMYLWDDVLRHGERTTIFGVDVKNYGQLVAKFMREEPVFNETLFSRFQDTAKSAESSADNRYAVRDNSALDESLDEALVAEQKPVGYLPPNDGEGS